MPEDDRIEVVIIKKDIGDIKEDISGIKKTFEKILFPLNDWKIQTDTKLKMGGWALGICGVAIIFNLVGLVWKVVLTGGH